MLRDDGVGVQTFSAKTFSGEHRRLGQASILADADCTLLLTGTFAKVF